ncbi:hypothetical protein M2280_003684 [Prescottella agglutinans]|uniref:Uncharacterized protein n=1 Tax=Prescottella agglutinans TaxID=1644129 RepID=A0ABT6MDQ7_9NOCA|nr:hypothetical protein [Prescottella agglutinans]
MDFQQLLTDLLRVGIGSWIGGDYTGSGRLGTDFLKALS